MKLTEHFNLEEFERSDTARRLGIDNTVPNGLLPNIQALCENVLEPVRQHFGVPIYLSSGYRCTALNKAVRGATASQHMKGEAADIYIKASPQLALWNIYVWMIDNLQFDQLIWETRPNGSKWIHVSYKSTGPNRQQVFTVKG